MGYGSGREDIARLSQYVQLYSIFSMWNTFDCTTVTKILNIRFTYNSFTVACSSLLVLAAEEQPVSLLLELLCGGILFRAASHLLHRLRGARLALLPYPVPRLFGWIIDRLKNALSLLVWINQIRDTGLSLKSALTQCIHCNAAEN